MIGNSPRTRCHLCEAPLEDAELRVHLRRVHQVAVGERTMADVPIGRMIAMKPTTSDRDQAPRILLAG